MKGIAAALVVAACSGPAASPTAPQNEAVAPPPSSGVKILPIEQIPGLAFDKPATARQDCRPSQVARRQFAGARVRACGTYDLVTEDDYAHARDYEDVAKRVRPLVDCAAAAIAANEPFLVEQRIPGIDSGVAHSLVGVTDHGKLAIYSLSYDDNPCGGGCPEKGRTSLNRCDGARRPPAAHCAMLAECFHCDLTASIDDCVFGQRAP